MSVASFSECLHVHSCVSVSVSVCVCVRARVRACVCACVRCVLYVRWCVFFQFSYRSHPLLSSLPISSLRAEEPQHHIFITENTTQ